jgi:hypothetical protein
MPRPKPWNTPSRPARSKPSLTTWASRWKTRMAIPSLLGKATWPAVTLGP